MYALARATAFDGDGPTAIQLLAEAQAKGFAYRSLVRKDAAFHNIKSNPDFTSILSKMEDLPNGVLPTRTFFGNSYWAKNGWPCSTPEQGDRYVLSTVLAVTGTNQSTLAQALAQIERSVAADGTNPKGNVYFAKHSDPRSRTRQSQFDFAAKELESLGRKAIITDKRLPKNDPQVVGATLGNAVIDWSKTGSRFVPGAICDNFTSYGGWWEKSGQTQLSDFLNAGAAGAWGTVYEPYTISWKIPNARLHSHYARGCTLAESFYQSISGPFQLLIVGDPLCCPFGSFPEFSVAGLKDGETVSGDFELSFEAAANSQKIRQFEIFFDGVFLSSIPILEKCFVATEALNDGYHEIRVVAVADSPTANRRGKTLNFQLNRKGQSVEFTILKTTVKAGGKVMYTARSAEQSEIKIIQNSRVVATSRSGEQGSIDSSKLGLGKSTLQAFARTKGGPRLRSAPVEVSVVN